MSVDTYVLCQAALPPKSEWQAALARQHFPLHLGQISDQAMQAGFWPGQLNGAATGFEFFPVDRSEFFAHFSNIDKPERFLYGVQFATHSDVNGFLAAVLTAVALARTCDGIVYDSQESRAYQGPEMDRLVQQTWRLSSTFTHKR